MKCEELELFKKYEVNLKRLEEVNAYKETMIERFLIPISFDIDYNGEIQGAKFLTDTFMEFPSFDGKLKIKTQNVMGIPITNIELIDFVLVEDEKEYSKLESTISNNGEIEFLREIIRNFSLKG